MAGAILVGLGARDKRLRSVIHMYMPVHGALHCIKSGHIPIVLPYLQAMLTRKACHQST